MSSSSSSSDNAASSSSSSSSSSSLPEDLRCDICHEMYQAAVSISDCNHSFCSHCIRSDFSRQMKSLKRKVCCPHCRAQLFERGISKAEQVLQPNLDLQQRVFAYKQQQQQQQDKANQSMSTTTSQGETNANDPCRRSTRGRRLESSPQEQSQAQHVRNPPLTRMPVPVYKGKKRKDLLQLLGQSGVPTYGNDNDLKTRHERFVLFWNSFCDEQVDPPTADVVVQRFRAKLLQAHQQRWTAPRRMPSSAAAAASSPQAATTTAKHPYAKEFQALLSNIQEKFAPTWSQNNFCLPILAIQKHDILQDASFLEVLRRRALSLDYDELPRLLTLLPKDCVESIQKASAAATAASSIAKTEMDDSKPPPQVDSTEADAAPAKREPPQHTGTEEVTAETKRSRTTPSSFPPHTATTTTTPHGTMEATAPTSPPSVVSKPLDTSYIVRAMTFQAAPSPFEIAARAESSSPLAMKDCNKKRPLPVATTPIQTPNVPIVSATKAPRKSITSTASHLARNQHTTATSTATNSFHYNRPKRPDRIAKNWQWTCAICMYEMKVDRRATKCACCGSAKGLTFDDVHNQNKENNNNGSSAESAISLC